MYPATGPDCIPPVKILPALEKYDPPEKTVVGRRPGHKWFVCGCVYDSTRVTHCYRLYFPPRPRWGAL